jgi:hypothetical protein
MTTLRQRLPYIVGLRDRPQLRRTASVHWPARVASDHWKPQTMPRRRGYVFRAIAHLLAVARDLLLAVWAIGAIAMFLVIVAAFV